MYWTFFTEEENTKSFLLKMEQKLVIKEAFGAVFTSFSFDITRFSQIICLVSMGGGGIIFVQLVQGRKKCSLIISLR